MSCVIPMKVNVLEPNDNELSCKELNIEISIANKYADKTKVAKKQISHIT